MPKSCDVGCQAEIQNFQILQPQVGTSTQDKPLESMEPEHPLDSEDTVEDEEVELHTEEEQNMEDVYHILTGPNAVQTLIQPWAQNRRMISNT